MGFKVRTIADIYKEGAPPDAYELYRQRVMLQNEPVVKWDGQVGGNHYSKLPIQPLEYALANGLGIMEHAVVKYTTRHKDKGGKQDLEKAIDYLQKMIQHYYPES